MLNGTLIKQFLKRERQSRVWLAMQLGISHSLLEKMLAGHRPKDETIDSLAAIMGIPRDQLVSSRKHAQTA